VGGLQMDWLRSEDLKEEKNVTASITIIAGRNNRWSVLN
jgi:dihydrofolate reductase